MSRRRRQLIIPWGAVAVIESIAIGAGFAVLTLSDRDAYDALIAKTAFLIACVIGVIQVILLSARRRGKMPYVVTFLSCGVVGMIGLASVNYVNHKRDRAAAKEAVLKSPSPAPSPSASPSPPDDGEDILLGRKKGPDVP